MIFTVRENTKVREYCDYLRLMKSHIYTNWFKENISIYQNESRHGFWPDL